MLVTSVHAQGPVERSPVRTWGEINSTYRERDYASFDAKATNWLNTATVNASSYIWRPWFATTNGTLNLSLDQSDYTDRSSKESEYISGNAALNVFPSSRFPAQLYYGQSRNKLDDDLINRDIETTEFQARQSYRTEDNAHQLRGEYIENTREDPMVSDIRGQRLLFSGTSQLENNTLGADIQVDTVKDNFRPQTSDSYSVSGSHTYNDGNNFTIDNLASTSEIDDDFVDYESIIDTAEFSSLMSWRPGPDQDLSLNGSLRLSEQDFSVTDNETTPEDEAFDLQNATANLNQGLLYRYSDNLLLRQFLNANQFETDNEVTRIYSESVGLGYTPDRFDIGIGDYGWSYDTSYVHQHGDIETENTWNNRFSHSIDRRRSLGDQTLLRSSFTQTLTYEERKLGFDTKRIDHSLLVSWTRSSNVDQAVVTLQLLDAREREDDDEVFQLVNLQFNGVLRFDRYRQLSGNATLQWSRREDDDDESIDTVTNGYLEYRHSRLFDVPRLVYRSRLILSQQKSETERLTGEIIENDSDEETWENSIEYLIGRLEASASIDFVKANGSYDRLFKIQLIRTFGDL